MDETDPEFVAKVYVLFGRILTITMMKETFSRPFSEFRKLKTMKKLK